jgi:chromosomal replication initiation ATPase DnaA
MNAFEQVVAICARNFEVTIEEIIGESKIMRIVYARMAVAFIMRQSASVTLQEIGDAMNRDHATISNLLKKFDCLRESDFTVIRTNVSLNEFKRWMQTQKSNHSKTLCAKCEVRNGLTLRPAALLTYKNQNNLNVRLMNFFPAKLQSL